MAINKDSIGFTFLFTILMVVVVGATLAFAAGSLKQRQDENVKLEKMQNILGSFGVECTREEASELFSEYVKNRLVLDNTGAVVTEKNGAITKGDADDAFNIDVKKQFRDQSMADEKRRYPLYACEKEGKSYFVIPMAGKGLWGPIWGFVALEDDLNTVFGAKFDHKTETPGLGAEINTPMFQDPFQGKNIFKADGSFASIKVVKGGAGPNDPHGVDAITGGTITSNGVDEMLERTLSTYAPYFKKNS